MRPALFCASILPLVFSTAAFANAGATSSGVTTTVGNSTDPSAQVQAQSSGFVQQNQQLQNGQAPNGTASSNTAVAVLPNAANGTNTPRNAGNDPGSTQHAENAAAPAAPAPPPPPPPVYESTIRKLDRSGATSAVNAPPPAVQKPEQDSMPAKPEPKPAQPTPAVAKAPVKPAAPNATAAARPNPAVEVPAERPVALPTVSGGRGEAPDGFTFYSGSAIAGMLLAFAFATYLKTGRNEDVK